MDTPHLDRLSALLGGLAPRVLVSQPPAGIRQIDVDAEPSPFLHLYLLADGTMHLHSFASENMTLSGPCIAICRSDMAHQLVATSANSFRQLIRARTLLEGPIASLLLNEFAAPRLVRLDDAESSLHHVVGLIVAELQAPRCGQPALLDRAGDILFIGLLRHLISQPQRSAGLLSGLADPRIARALVAIHSQPQNNWSLESLAEEAGMSRTSFANTFRSVIRQTPGKYLSTVRLAIAQRILQSGKGLKEAAAKAGYANTSALSRALSRFASASS
jgi:AraC-like DNA-binding protein